MVEGYPPTEQGGVRLLSSREKYEERKGKRKMDNVKETGETELYGKDKEKCQICKEAQMVDEVNNVNDIFEPWKGEK
jgi:hypothetical protein